MDIFLFLFFFFLVASAAYAAHSGAPWVPSRRGDIERFFKLADPKPGEKMYDLGCGDGRIVIEAAKRFGVRGVGVELSILQAMAAWIRNKIVRTDVRVRWANLFKVDLRDADLVYLFLMPDTYGKIRSKLEAELKPGTRVVSYVWPIPDWTPTVVDKAEGKSGLYLYKR